MRVDSIVRRPEGSSGEKQILYARQRPHAPPPSPRALPPPRLPPPSVPVGVLQSSPPKPPLQAPLPRPCRDRGTTVVGGAKGGGRGGEGGRGSGKAAKEGTERGGKGKGGGKAKKAVSMADLDAELESYRSMA